MTINVCRIIWLLLCVVLLLCDLFCCLCSKILCLLWLFELFIYFLLFIILSSLSCLNSRNRQNFMAPNVKCILMLCLFSISYMPDVWFCGLKCGVVDIVLELQQSKPPILSWVACYFYVHLSLFGLTCMYCCECIHCIYVLICTDCWMYLLYLCIDLYWLLSNIYR